MRPLLSKRLGMPLAGVRFVEDNGCCSIYEAFVGDDPVIIKQYRGQNPHPATSEAEALRLYGRICDDVPGAMPVRLLGFNGHTSTLCIERVAGRPLTRLVADARGDPARQAETARAMALVGVLLRRLYDTTRTSGVGPSQLLREQMEQASSELAEVPLVGRALFGGYRWDVAILWHELLRAEEPTSVTHGDPQLDNVLVRGDRVALTGFQNSNGAGHLLADGYAMSVSLRTRRLPEGFQGRLIDALHQGLDLPRFPDAVHRFYWELQRRRWLFLRLVRGSAIERARGLRSLSELGVQLPLPEAS